MRDYMVCFEILKEYEASFPTFSWITVSLAFILVNSEIGREKEVLGMLRALPAVRDAYEVYGAYDIFLRVKADSQKAFQQAITVIRRVAGVRSTLTMVVINE
jgi:DNA-binding Lrp family transcriptional regulator